MIQIHTTERRHWCNGHQLRGGWHHSLALSLPFFPYAVMFTWGELPNGYRQDSLQINLYKLI